MRVLRLTSMSFCASKVPDCSAIDIPYHKNTNVIELYNLILKKEMARQQTWYNSGIGTYARPSYKSLNYYKEVLFHKIDLAIAWFAHSSLPVRQLGPETISL